MVKKRRERLTAGSPSSREPKPRWRALEGEAVPSRENGRADENGALLDAAAHRRFAIKSGTVAAMAGFG